MLADDNRALLRPIGWFAGGLFIIFVCIWGFNYLTTGKLTVMTTSKNVGITVTRLGSKGNTASLAPSPETPQDLSKRVKPGTYVLTVSSKSSAVNKTVSIKARQHMTFTLNPVKANAPEFVYGSGASSVEADTSQILFIDVLGRLAKINSQNAVSTFSSPHRLKNIRWANTSFGVAQDDTGNFYTVTAGNLSPLVPPFQITGGSSSSYTVSKSGTIYISNGQTIYSNVGGNFKEIYSSGSNYNVALSAGGSSLAVIEKDSTSNHSSLVVINSSGDIKRKGISLDHVSWSPDGQHLLAAGVGGSIVFNADLNSPAYMPQIKGANFAWLNNKVFSYTVGSQLWSYDLVAKQASQIANIPNKGTIHETSLSNDSAYLYITAQKIGFNGEVSAYQLFRVGLNGQAVPPYSQSLSVFLPENIGSCSLDYINFTSPTINTIYQPVTTAPPFCINAAKGELQYYNINPGGFGFTATPSDGD